MVRTCLVDLHVARSMAAPMSVSCGTRRQRAILDRTRDIITSWSERSHDRNQVKKVAVAQEEIVEFSRTLGSLRCGGYYERSAYREIGYYRDQLAIPFRRKS